MSKHLPTDSINIKQTGMVSIIVTVILMFVISITVLGFAQVIRRSQREALDNQLSTQAFYAAESGINDARTILAANPGSSLTSCAKPSPPNPFSTLDYMVDAAHGVSYSCLLVEPSPSQLKYDLDPSAQSKIIPIDTHGSFDTLKLHWSNSDDPATPTNANCPATNDLPKVSAAPKWTCPEAMLRMDMVSVGTLSRVALLRNNFTAFLDPVFSGGGTVPFEPGPLNVYKGTASQGARPKANCTATGCDMKITGSFSGQYYLRISALYRPATLTIQAETSNNPQPLYGAEASVDATGKAQDVLRRLRVYVPLSGNAAHADYGLQTTNDICKLFTTFPGNTNDIGCSPVYVPPGSSSETCAALEKDGNYIFFNLRDYPKIDPSDWHLDPEKGHIKSTIPFPATLPSGTYTYWAFAKDDTKGAGQENQRLHYLFYDAADKLIGQTVDTPDIADNATLSEGTSGSISLTGLKYIMAAHSPLDGAVDQGVDSECLALTRTGP